MNALAIELSSGQGSLAVFRGGDLVGTTHWQQHRRDGQALFREWPCLLERVALKPSEIGLYIVGRGPGTFSGLRVALSAARAAAIPCGARVYALSSGEALAADLLADHEADAVAIVGDARRDRLWCGIFRRGPSTDPTWNLVRPGDFLQHVADAPLWASPQFSRLGGLLPDAVRTHPAWIPCDRLPRADALGRAALTRIQHDRPSEPFSPLYLHPPVAPRTHEA